ncbi:CapA family protein [uncultured Winogradskyella sp.]|uniref:CapA family protein n=1 Tax=uncultured Winogradskyella sp. TaxID=395353 RepID=UPI002609D331|nr:CapA family protein [uncultured Winogradskyella sp.]
MHKEEITIIIGGDVYPKGKVEPYFINGQAEDIFNDVLPIFKEADYTVVNLECPLADKEIPILKDGAALRAVTKTVNGMKASGIDAVNLSNNHILDQGAQGIDSTINTLSDNQIAYFGAGKNLEAASETHIVTIKGKKIAFLGVAEHEFTIATETSHGANPLHIPNNIRQIRALRKQVDYIVMLYHGGKEHYVYPTPNQQNISRFFIEEGVDIIIAQHSHIAGSYENYMGKPIVYGQGNFLFEKLSRNYKSWFEGLIVKLKLNSDKIDISFIPIEQSKNFIGVKQMDTEASHIMLQQFKTHSDNVKNPQFVKEEWKKLCTKELNLYKSRLHGHNRLLRVLNRKINFAKWLYPKWKSIMIRNVVECETHREGLETLWKDDEIDF